MMIQEFFEKIPSFALTILHGIAALATFFLVPSLHAQIMILALLVFNSYSLRRVRRTSPYRKRNAEYKPMDLVEESRLIRKIQYCTIIAIASGFIAHLCFSFREAASVMLMGGTILFGSLCVASSLFAVCFYRYFIMNP